MTFRDVRLQPVENVTPLTSCDDVWRWFRVGRCLALRGWDSGSEPHYGIKTSSMVYWSSCGSDQAMCLEELLVADGV